MIKLQHQIPFSHPAFYDKVLPICVETSELQTGNLFDVCYQKYEDTGFWVTHTVHFLFISILTQKRFFFEDLLVSNRQMGLYLAEGVRITMFKKHRRWQHSATPSKNNQILILGAKNEKVNNGTQRKILFGGRYHKQQFGFTTLKDWDLSRFSLFVLPWDFIL